MKQPVSLVIPAYNERLGVAGVVSELRELCAREGIAAEVLVVDDGSSDGTGEAAAGAGARVIRHRGNRGYGAALKTGIAAARHDIVVITDADGTYPSRYIPALIRALESSDMAVGARIGSHVSIPAIRKPAKWVLKVLANYVSQTRIPDLNSGLRAFRKAVAGQYFPILPDQFSFTTTITLAMLCDKYAVSYVPIDYLPRKGKSKIVPWDAGSFAVLILRMAMMFRPLRVFLPIVGLCLLYGSVKMAIDMVRDPNISASALLAFMSALIILLIGMLADAVVTRLARLNPKSVGVRADDEEILPAGGETAPQSRG